MHPTAGEEVKSPSEMRSGPRELHHLNVVPQLLGLEHISSELSALTTRKDKQVDALRGQGLTLTRPP